MRRLVAIGCVLLTTTACTNGKINSGNPIRTEPSAALSAGNKPLREMQIDLPATLSAALRAKNQLVPDTTAAPVTMISERQLEKLIVAVDFSGDEAIRNSVVSQLIAASTANCSVYLQALRSGQVSSRLTADVASTVFGIAGSLTEPVRSAKILSGLSAFSTATGASIDRTIFAQQGAELIADAITQLRNDDRRLLEKRMSQNLQQWTMGLALADLYRFHGDCSMVRGLSRMREAVTARDQDVRAVRLAAAAIARNGGSAADVAEAVAGLSAPPELANDSAQTPPQAPADAAMDLDLQLMRQKAMDCFATYRTQIDAAAPNAKAGDLPALKNGGPCSTASSAWSQRFSSKVGKAVADVSVPDTALTTASADAAQKALDLKAAEQNLGKAQSNLDAAQNIQDPAKRDAAIVKANAELATATTNQTDAASAKARADKDLNDKSDERRRDLKAAVMAKQPTVTQAINDDLNFVANTRKIAVQAIKDIASPRTATDVATILKGLAGPDLSVSDPAFIMAIAAAEKVASITEQKDSAALASIMARNAIRDYIDSNK